MADNKNEARSLLCYSEDVQFGHEEPSKSGTARNKDLTLLERNGRLWVEVPDERRNEKEAPRSHRRLAERNL